MRMVHAIHENSYEGAQDVRQTGIGGDAKIVYALLSGMVSDKVEYPVREIATNAWEVSPPGRPPEIELPTRFNLQFRCRDYGPGLSHRFMMNRYAKIGDSTKDNDDDAVGGWGFGSKSPLAYLMRSDGAGSFTAISRHKGFRRTYSIGVSETGKIQIQFLGEWPLEVDDNGTGLEIMFPVRPEDQQRFHDHAREIYWSFEPRPRVTPAIDFGSPVILHKGDGWTIYKPGSVPFSGPQVKLGPVMYPVDMALAPHANGWVDSDDCIVFDAKIGTISVSASRENLQYDDRTETGLSAIFEHYKQDWLDKARIAVDAETTFFRAQWKAQDIARSLGKRGWYMARQIGWRGYRFGDALLEDVDAKAALWPEVMGWQRENKYAPVKFTGNSSINPGELGNRLVVIQHSTSRSRERFEAAGLMDTPCVWVRVKRANLEAALDSMGRPEYIVLDSVKLDKVERGTREKRPESMVKRKTISHDFCKTENEWIDNDDENVYVTFEGRGRQRDIYTSVDGKTKYWSRREADNIMMEAERLGLIEGGLKLVALDRYEEAPEHWRSLGDVIAEAIDEQMDVTKVSPVIPWGTSSFPDALRQLQQYNVDLGCAPQDLRDLYYNMVALLKTRDGMAAVAGNKHDKLAALNMKVTGTDVKTIAKDPTRPVRDGFMAFIAANPIFAIIMRDIDRRHYSNKVDAAGQRAVDAYFNLIAK